MKRSDVVMLQFKSFNNKFNNEKNLSSLKAPQSLGCIIHKYVENYLM